MSATASQTSKFIRSLKEMDLRGKVVFVRVDFNVPIDESSNISGPRTLLDDNRIVESLPTIRYCMEQGARVVLASHMGRPKGKRDPLFSLEPVALHLAKLLGQDVTLADDCVGEGIELMAKNLKPGQVMLLENLRFHSAEEGNDAQFCTQLSRIAEVYVNDAFGTSHRKHASVYGLPALMPMKGMGLLIEKELKFLDPLLHSPAKPFYAVLGGSKVSDKIKTIESLLRTVDGLLIGGAMAFAFDAAQDKPVPENVKKKPGAEDIEAAKNVLSLARKRNIPVLLPTDTVESFDIGPKTTAAFSEFLAKAKTVFWNGPLGWFEKPEYAHGTFKVAQALAEVPNCIKVVGGGDTVSAIKQSGVAEKFEHLSTGGGAVLEYLEGQGLPGIEILKVLPNRK